MSNTINSMILDGVAERLFALEEVLNPSAYAAFKAHLEALASAGDFDRLEADLRAMEDAQDV